MQQNEETVSTRVRFRKFYRYIDNMVCLILQRTFYDLIEFRWVLSRFQMNLRSLCIKRKCYQKN